jgi:hypothetical protein
MDARALIDTGAEVTCADAALITRLALHFGGFVAANLPAHGGTTFAGIYNAALTILHPSGKVQDHLSLIDHSVLELNLSPLSYEILIGRDVLNRCRFTYDGPNGQFRLVY